MSKKKEAAEEVMAVEEAEAMEAVKTEESIETEEKEKDDSFCIYLGPTVTRVVNYGKIYKCTREAALEELKDGICRYPIIADLLISSKRLAEDRMKIKTPGNLLYRKYKELEKSLRNGG